VSFTGSSFSGIASCTPSTAYAGPDSSSATVTGTCTDNAGKTVSATASFQYETTPPSLSLAADTGDRTVALSWQTGTDAAPLASVQIVRTSGRNRSARRTTYSGGAGVYHDTRVSDGVRYTYTVTAVDQAGNSTVRTVALTPGPHLIAPGPSAHLAGPRLLSWTPVRRAAYYNLQLYRNGTKILSVWPTKARLALRRKWRFAGHRYRLKPGVYHWYVWPGFGSRAADRYGRLIGARSFVVT
jgi:hypothetical protein